MKSFLILLILASFVATVNAEPNIALEQLNSAANFDEVQKIRQENQEKWNKAIEDYEEGKMFTSKCDELTGICEYEWVDPPHYILLTNERTGENMTQAVYCDKGETWNEKTISCENKELVMYQILILLLVTGAGIVLGSWRYFKKLPQTFQNNEEKKQ